MILIKQSRLIAVAGGVLLTFLVVIGVVCVACVVVPPLASLAETGHPYLGWSDWVVADAMELASGQLIYADPGHAYVGLLYMPLYDIAFAALLKVSWWEGWGVVLSFAAFLVSACALAITTGRIGRGASWFSRLADVAARAGFWIAVLWYFMSSIPVNGIFEARPEQFAWMWTVLAVAALASGLATRRSLSRPRLALIFVLLAAAIFSKQTTAPFAALVALAAIWSQVRSFGTMRGALREVAISAVPAVVLSLFFVALLQWLSGGFFVDLVVGVPSRHARVRSLDLAFDGIAALARSAGVFAVLCAAIAAIPLWKRTIRWRARWVVIWCAVATVVQIYASSTALTKQGADTNQAVGLVFVLSVVCAFAIRTCGVTFGRPLMIGLLALSLLVPIGLSSPLYSQAKSARAGNTVVFSPMPAELIAANAAGKRVFDPYFFPSTGVLRDADGDPGFLFTELVPAGYAPRSMVTGLLGGEYALATKLDAPYLDEYASAFGRRDDSVAWKVNWILDKAFEPSRVQVGGIRYLQPRQDIGRFAWMAGCFSPWAGGDTRVVQVGGVSAWCLNDGVLRLRRYEGLFTTFALIVPESVTVRLVSGHYVDACPHMAVAGSRKPVTLIKVGRHGGFACEYAVVVPEGTDALQAELVVPNKSFGELAVVGTKLGLLSPRPGDPVLTLTRGLTSATK